jgi:small basic protein (TIGR04137 family)
MTMDRSLKPRRGLGGNRSVLSRDERITRLIEEEKFESEKNSPLGLAKTRVRHSKIGIKAKKTAEEKAAAEGEVAAAAPAGVAGPGGKGAAPVKGAAPAKGAAAAPAAGKAAKGGKKEK